MCLYVNEIIISQMISQKVPLMSQIDLVKPLSQSES